MQVCIVTGADMQEQVGHSIFFDLVDYDKVSVKGLTSTGNYVQHLSQFLQDSD